jgi:hypothetical protein
VLCNGNDNHLNGRDGGGRISPLSSP